MSWKITYRHDGQTARVFWRGGAVVVEGDEPLRGEIEAQLGQEHEFTVGDPQPDPLTTADYSIEVRPIRSEFELAVVALRDGADVREIA